ncbi:MAG: MarR family winged helix-turn-helix transcriptional regulator [Tomitella sp.]|nr:MarR family winged helix-turn-helix transcriptional regulator [Tomitella sp.]
MEITTGDRLVEVIDEFLGTLHHGSDSAVLDVFVDLELTLTQLRVIFMLAMRDEEVPINEVADHLKISVATAGRTVERLMGVGIVDRREDPDDRRSKLVSLTDEGRSLADTQREQMREQIRSFNRVLPTDVAEELQAALQRALDVIPPHFRAGAACTTRNQVRTFS